MREKVTSPMGVGVISIITILLVLVLAIFSCLTLSTARADYALAQRGAETVKHYYEADSQAQVWYTFFLREENRDSFEGVIPMDDMQGLRVQFMRLDGKAHILAWQTVMIQDFSEYATWYLPVWTGEEE